MARSLRRAIHTKRLTAEHNSPSNALYFCPQPDIALKLFGTEISPGPDWSGQVERGVLCPSRA